MIWLKRSCVPTPKTLVTKGKEATAEIKKRVLRGETDLSFKGAIYAATDVRKALRKVHHGKCAFCESQLPQSTAGHVEHFRPKTEVQQDVGTPLLKPGYYWLAYDWNNLLLACEWCNTRAKRRLFPLKNPARRAVSHRQKLSKEFPLLLDPTTDNPSKHIEFVGEFVRPKNGSIRGDKSIKTYRLDDYGLTEERRRKLHLFKALLMLAKRSQPLPDVKDALDEADRWRKRIKTGDIEYAGMLRENL